MKSDGFGPRGYTKYEEREFISSEFSWIENDAIWSFLFRKIHHQNTSRIDQGGCDPQSVTLWEQYNMVTRSRRPLWKLKNHFLDNLGPNLHRAFLPGEAKIKLYFGLGIPVDSDFLRDLREEARVVVDTFGRMIVYSGSGMHLESRKDRPIVNSSELQNMWNYLCDKIHDPETGGVYQPRQMPSCTALWKEYRDKYQVPKTVNMLFQTYKNEMIPFIQLSGLDLSTKAKLCFSLRIPVSQDLLAELQTTGIARLDRLNMLTYYGESETDLILAVEEPAKRNLFSEEEDNLMYSFVYRKLLDPVTRRIRRDWKIINSKELWMEFNGENKFRRDPNTYIRRFRNILIPAIYMAKIPKMMRMALHYGLEIPITPGWLKELRKDAIIELDPNGCILVYRARKRLYSVDDDDDDVIFLGNTEPKIQKKAEEVITIQEEDVEPAPLLENFASESCEDVLFLHDEPAPELEIAAPTSSTEPNSMEKSIFDMELDEPIYPDIAKDIQLTSSESSQNDDEIDMSGIREIVDELILQIENRH